MTSIQKIITQVVGRMAVEGHLSTEARDELLRSWFSRWRDDLRRAKKRGQPSIVVTVQSSPEVPISNDVTVRKIDDLIEIVAENYHISPTRARNILYENNAKSH